MTICGEFFNGGRPKRSAWPLFRSFFLTPSLKRKIKSGHHQALGLVPLPELEQRALNIRRQSGGQQMKVGMKVIFEKKWYCWVKQISGKVSEQKQPIELVYFSSVCCPCGQCTPPCSAQVSTCRTRFSRWFSFSQVPHRWPDIEEPFPTFRCATWKASLTAWRKDGERATAWVQSCLMRLRFVGEYFLTENIVLFALQLLDWLQNFKEIQTELNSCLTCLEVTSQLQLPQQKITRNTHRTVQLRLTHLADQALQGLIQAGIKYTFWMNKFAKMSLLGCSGLRCPTNLALLQKPKILLNKLFT